MQDCYVIKMTKYSRTDEERTLPEYGIFKTKELAISKIKLLAKFYAEKTDRTIFDESTDEDIKFIVKYDSCEMCPEYDEDCRCSECYEDIYEFTVVKYNFISDWSDYLNALQIGENQTS